MPKSTAAHREPVDRKRVLIIDDKVGHHLKRLLWDCSCTVEERFEDFEQHLPHLDKFALALVDVNLTDSYLDHQGLEIVNRIVNADTDILVLGMTMRPILGATREWQRRHDLTELIHKSGDDETADFSNVVNHVRSMLVAGPRAQVAHAMEELPRIIEEARTKMLAAGRDQDLLRLQADAGRILAMQFSDEPGTLAAVRGAIRDFRKNWNVQFSLR